MRWLRKNLIGIVAILVLVYLFIPIAVIMVLSFNNPKGKFNLSWNEFSLDAWTNLCGVPGRVLVLRDEHRDRPHLDDHRDDPRAR